jgi:hypothetical protein
MSSHREAPEISKDPVADSSDVYCFVSPDDPSKVTMIANYVPLQGPAGGPNFFEFGDDVLYEIHIDQTGDGRADITYQFRFDTNNTVGNTFLYNVGPITALNSPNWNRKQTYSVVRLHHGVPKVLGRNLPCPPCNIGPLSTPGYTGLAASAVQTLDGDVKVFAGQRADAFYVDLGSVFDLAILRKFQQLHNKFGVKADELNTPAPGRNGLANLNVHTIAIQVPKTKLTVDGSNPTDVMSKKSVIGIWTTASRRAASVRSDQYERPVQTGPFKQVSRLGMPLLNEVLIPIEKKDFWNKQSPHRDSQFQAHLTQPELAGLLPVLYPDVFPNLAALNKSKAPRNDILAIFHTGLPAGVVPGFQNSLSDHQADELRLNMAVPPSSSPSNLGLIDGDAAGFPNGRRPFDDIATVEIRALAGVTYPLVAKGFTPDGAANIVTDDNTNSTSDQTAKGTVSLLKTFPFLGTPHDGYHTP